ncbi:MAG: ankyrin repeat domain-containing protein [Candidatus Aminicenantes bacterium]
MGNFNRDQDESNYSKQLYKAVWDGKHEDVLRLIAAGADVNVVGDTPIMDSALIRACMGKEHPEIVESLLANGANVNEQDVDGNTALHHILYYGARSDAARDILRLLISYRADFSIQNKEGKSPLNFAQGCYCFPTVVLISKHLGKPVREVGLGCPVCHKFLKISPVVISDITETSSISCPSGCRGFTVIPDGLLTYVLLNLHIETEQRGDKKISFTDALAVLKEYHCGTQQKKQKTLWSRVSALLQKRNLESLQPISESSLSVEELIERCWRTLDKISGGMECSKQKSSRTLDVDILSWREIIRIDHTDYVERICTFTS